MYISIYIYIWLYIYRGIHNSIYLYPSVCVSVSALPQGASFAPSCVRGRWTDQSLQLGAWEVLGLGGNRWDGDILSSWPGPSAGGWGTLRIGGTWENPQKRPGIGGKTHGFRCRFSPTNQSIDQWVHLRVKCGQNIGNIGSWGRQELDCGFPSRGYHGL